MTAKRLKELRAETEQIAEVLSGHFGHEASTGERLEKMKYMLRRAQMQGDAGKANALEGFIATCEEYLAAGEALAKRLSSTVDVSEDETDEIFIYFYDVLYDNSTRRDVCLDGLLSVGESALKKGILDVVGKAAFFALAIKGYSYTGKPWRARRYAQRLEEILGALLNEADGEYYLNIVEMCRTLAFFYCEIKRPDLAGDIMMRASDLCECRRGGLYSHPLFQANARRACKSPGGRRNTRKIRRLCRRCY